MVSRDVGGVTRALVSLHWGLIMRRLQTALLATVAAIGFASIASAADMPVKGVRAPVAVPFSWTGFYVGATAGYGWGSYTLGDATGDGPGVDPKGFIGGGEIGYNWQVNNFVLGLEADIQNGPRGTTARFTVGPAWACNSGVCRTDITYFGTVRARAGLTWDQWLVYATGGWAYGHFNGGIDNSAQSGSSNKSGWAAGAGVEYAINRAWSVKAEWLHVDLGTADFGTGIGTNRFQGRGDFDVVRAGVNFHFGAL